MAKNITIDDLRFDEHNFNKHTEQGMKLLDKSIKENKFGRSILVDKDNNVIAGNGVLETAKKQGEVKIKVVETTGDELVVVKRNDVTLDSEMGRNLALADNAVANVDLEWDAEELQKAQNEWGIVPEDWGAKVLDDLSTDSDYDEFVDKFKPKQTTDDCYTPIGIYNLVKEMVLEKFNLTNVAIKRPFKPNGDYVKELESYTENDIVIDNPPFSIITEIQRVYMSEGVKFFLFAPHLTLFGSMVEGVSKIVTEASIIYANGANVSTSFVTNMFDEPVICTWSDLRNKIKDFQDSEKNKLPKYKFPDEILTVTLMSKLMKGDVDMSIKIKDTYKIAKLESQGKDGIFGGAVMISAKDAKSIRSAIDMAKIQKMEKDRVIEQEYEENRKRFDLSEEEKQIVKNLGESSDGVIVTNNYKK